MLRAPVPGEVPAASASTALKQTLRDFRPSEMLATPLLYVMYVALLCVAVGGVMATPQLGPIARDYIVDEVPVTVLLFTLPALQWALVFDRILNGLARPAFGWLSDRIGRENTMFIAFGGQSIIILIFIQVASNPYWFVVMSALVFFTYGEIFSLFPSLNADTYGRKFATTNYGFLYTAKGTAVLLVPFGNILQEHYHTWVPIFYAVAALNLCAGFWQCFVIKPMRARKAAAEAALPAGAG